MLWITSPQRAFAAATALILVLGAAIALEWSQPWRFAARFDLSPSAPLEARVVAALASAAQDSAELVVLVGGSTAQELTSSDRRISDQLSHYCGRNLRFVNAGTSTQSLADTWAITDALRGAKLKTVIIGTNYLRFEQGYALLRSSLKFHSLPFPRSSSLQAALERRGKQLPAELPNFRQLGWLLSLAGHVTAIGEHPSQPAPTTSFDGPNNFRKPPALTTQQKSIIGRIMLLDRLGSYRRSHEEATELWLDFSADLRARGIRTAYLVLPESESLAPFARLAGGTLSEDLAKLQSRGSKVADWRQGHGLSESDFYDQQHLLASGRKKLEDKFVTLLVQTIGCRS